MHHECVNLAEGRMPEGPRETADGRETMALPEGDCRGVRADDEVELHGRETELASRFENYDPTPQEERDPEAFVALRDAVLSRSDAERSIKAAVDNARAHGYSWALIGSLLGTSGEAARQRYATKQRA